MNILQILQYWQLFLIFFFGPEKNCSKAHSNLMSHFPLKQGRKKHASSPPPISRSDPFKPKRERKTERRKDQGGRKEPKERKKNTLHQLNQPQNSTRNTAFQPYTTSITPYTTPTFHSSRKQPLKTTTKAITATVFSPRRSFFISSNLTRGSTSTALYFSKQGSFSYWF